MTETAEVEMADQDTTNSNGGATKTVVRATVASLASGAIAYGIRKAAPAIRQKLQSIGEDGSMPGAETLGKAKDAVGEKVEAATSAVTDRIGVGGGSSGSSRSGNSGSSRSNHSLSEKELESRLRERAQHRKQRQKASTT
jgi:hypothetical protein